MSKEFQAWQCEKCGVVYISKEKADDCCKPKPKESKCRVCGCTIDYPKAICPECWEKEIFEKGKHVKLSEYTGGMIYDHRTDKYYASKEELEDDYFCTAEDEGREPEYPTWCFGCSETPFSVNIDSALETASEEMYDDFNTDYEAVEIKELLDFIKEWNAKQTAKTYYEDRKVIVLLNE